MRRHLLRWASLAAIAIASIGSFSFTSQTKGQSEDPSVRMAAPDATKIALLTASVPTRDMEQKTPIPDKIPAPPTSAPGATSTPYYPDSIPSGAGLIIPRGPGQPMRGINLHTTWRYVTPSGLEAFVYVGELQENPSQGIVVLEEPPSARIARPLTMYEVPNQAGPLRVIGAEEHTLIIKGASGRLFEFDAIQRTLVTR